MDSDPYFRTAASERPPRRYLTLPEVADLLGLPECEVYRRVRRGDWPGTLRLNSDPRWLVPRDALET